MKGKHSKVNDKSEYKGGDEMEYSPASPQKKYKRNKQPKRVARFISNIPFDLHVLNQAQFNVPQQPKPCMPKSEKIITKPNSNSVQPQHCFAFMPQIKLQPQFKSPTPQPVLPVDLTKHVPSCFDIIPRGNCPGIKISTCELFY